LDEKSLLFTDPMLHSLFNVIDLKNSKTKSFSGERFLQWQK